MRLIDADEILTRIQKAYVDTDLGTNKRAIAINIGLTKALNNVQDCKKIEQKKGKWIGGKCDQCGEHAPFWPMASTYYRSRFCPNCGARMEGFDETD